jgi:hypothetical protein
MPSPSSPPPTRPPRRYFRFTLRLLLATLTLLCLFLALWTHRARQQRRAVERIQSVGGRVMYQRDFDGPYDSWRQPRIPDWLLRKLGLDSFYYVRHVSLYNVPCNSSLIADVAGLPGLVEFEVHVEQLTDNDLTPIAGASSLQSLCLKRGLNSNRGLEIGDPSLKVIAQLPALRTVSIDGRQITKRGLTALGRSNTLESVSIDGVEDDLETGVDEMFHPERVKFLWIMRSRGSGNGSLGIVRLPHMPP